MAQKSPRECYGRYVSQIMIGVPAIVECRTPTFYYNRYLGRLSQIIIGAPTTGEIEPLQSTYSIGTWNPLEGVSGSRRVLKRLGKGLNV